MIIPELGLLKQNYSASHHFFTLFFNSFALSEVLPNVSVAPAFEDDHSSVQLTAGVSNSFNSDQLGTKSFAASQTFRRIFAFQVFPLWVELD